MESSCSLLLFFWNWKYRPGPIKTETTEASMLITKARLTVTSSIRFRHPGNVTTLDNDQLDAK